jgi:hypothetical protein
MARQLEASSRNQGQKFVALQAHPQIDEAAWRRSEKVQHRISKGFNPYLRCDAAFGCRHSQWSKVAARCCADRRNPFKGALNVSSRESIDGSLTLDRRKNWP